MITPEGLTTSGPKVAPERKCLFPGCKSLRRMGSGAKYCVPHTEIQHALNQKKAIANYRASLPEVYAPKPKKCEWCGETEIFHPAHYCDTCRDEAVKFKKKQSSQALKTKKKVLSEDQADKIDAKKRRQDIADATAIRSRFERMGPTMQEAINRRLMQGALL